MKSILKKALQNVGLEFEGEIKDATSDITIFVNQDDIKRGLEIDALECAAAQCLQRAMGAKKVAMFLSTAYVQLPNETDVTRYMVPPLLRKNVVKPQDEGRIGIPGVYNLLAPKLGNRLGQAVMRRQQIKELRSLGIAPPPRKSPISYKSRPLRTRWASRV